MDKENAVYILNGVLHHKKDEIMSFAGKWMELKIIMVSKISQSPDKYRIFSLLCRILIFFNDMTAEGRLFGKKKRD
jgi:hypothetical protein